MLRPPVRRELSPPLTAIAHDTNLDRGPFEYLNKVAKRLRRLIPVDGAKPRSLKSPNEIRNMTGRLRRHASLGDFHSAEFCQPVSARRTDLGAPTSIKAETGGRELWDYGRGATITFQGDHAVSGGTHAAIGG